MIARSIALASSKIIGLEALDTPGETGEPAAALRQPQEVRHDEQLVAVGVMHVVVDVGMFVVGRVMVMRMRVLAGERRIV